MSRKSTRIKVPCHYCGKVCLRTEAYIKKRKEVGTGNIYCSQKCKMTFATSVLEKHPHYRGGKIIRYKKYHKYYYIKVKNHLATKSKQKYVPEHVLVIEKYLGRYLTKGEIVHHKNGNTLDNRIENLEIMTRSEHMKHHLMKIINGRKDLLTPFNYHGPSINPSSIRL